MSVESILESIEKLTLLEAAELVKAMEEKFGVSAAAPVAVAAAPVAAAAEEAAAGSDEVSVILASAGANKIAVLKEVKKGQVIAAALDGKLLDAKETQVLADLPSKEELYAKMLGCINSPATGIVGSINAVMSGLVRAMDQVAKQKQA